MEYWNTGILEYWNTGILEYWNVYNSHPFSSHHSIIPSFHHSLIILIKRPMGAIQSYLLRGWIFTDETIDKIISNSFEIDCIDIRLTQKTDKDPIIHTGPGTIYQDYIDYSEERWPGKKFQLKE